MKILLTLYPGEANIDKAVMWAREAGYQVDEFATADHGRCVTIKGEVSTVDLEVILFLLQPD